MNTLTTLIFILWLPQAIYQVVIWTYWLQIKEYRYDRFWVFVKTADGKDSLNIINIVIKAVVIILSFYFLPLLIIVMAYLDYIFIRGVIVKKVRIPVITKRVRRIWFVSFLGILLAFILLNYFHYLSLLIGEGFLVLTPFLGVAVTIPLVNKAKQYEIKKAKELLKKHSQIVIGITGSYGKTTTKDFLYQLLSTRYECLETLKNQNTHFGILRRINSDLKREHEFFIAEIGAYKKGEISEIAKIINPKMAIITGIEPQHLELFGSFENLKGAKFELVESLQKNGKAFFNLSDENTLSLYEKAKKLGNNIKTYTYGVSSDKSFEAVSKILRVTAKGISFSVKIGREVKNIKTNIISKDLIENLTGAILVARLFKVPWAKINDKCNNLTLPKSTMNVFKTKEGVTVIDDSYNASPSGFRLALETLNLVKGKRKFVVTTGIIELGFESYKEHKRIGNNLEKYADCVLLRYKSFESSLLSGMKKKDKLKVITDPKMIVDYLKANLRKGDAVLIEGKIPLVLKYFINK